MKKLKVRKAIAKRFKITSTGKVISRRAFHSHLKLNKSKSRLRRMKVPNEITGRMATKIKKALGA